MFAITDALAGSLIAAITTLLNTFVSALMVYWLSRINSKIDRTKDIAKESAQNLKDLC